MNAEEWKNKLLSQAYKGISPLEFGMTPSEVIQVIGRPDGTSDENPPQIFRYAGVELHFDRQNDYTLFRVCDETGALSVQFEAGLYDALAAVSRELTDNEAVYSRLYGEGQSLLADYKARGGTQENAYNTVHRLYIDNRRDGGEEDLICDWLDCLCGWFGNPDVCIW